MGFPHLQLVRPLPCSPSLRTTLLTTPRARSVLAILQIYAAVSSLSLSFFATAIDAIFDPAANLVLHYCHRKAQTVDLQKFPSVRQSPHCRRQERER